MTDEQRAQHREEVLKRVMGDELMQALEKMRQIDADLMGIVSRGSYAIEPIVEARRVAIEDVLAAVLNRVQATSASGMLRPYERLEQRIANHDVRLDKKKVSIADLRMIVEAQEERIQNLEALMGAGHDDW